MLKQTLTAAACAAVLLTGISARAANDPLAAAKDLYASASYEDALQALNTIAGASRTPEDRRAIDLYRALCLVALGRAEDARQAMETLVADDPSYRPASDDLPPRVLEELTATRKRLLPTIIENRYAAAKAAFDQKQYKTAADAFQAVLDGLKDPDISDVASQSPLADLRTLAVGFHDLSARAAAPPPPPAPTPAPKPVAAAPQPPRIYTAADARVIAPSAISQTMPPYPGRVITARRGVVEVVVGESGAVESAAMPVSIDPSFDARILSEARKWRYKPATLDGTPVKFRKMIQVALTPGT